MKPQLDPKLVERVAKAIFRAVSHLDNDGTQWTQFVEESHEEYRVMARAAILTMRKSP